MVPSHEGETCLSSSWCTGSPVPVLQEQIGPVWAETSLFAHRHLFSNASSCQEKLALRASPPVTPAPFDWEVTESVLFSTSEAACGASGSGVWHKSAPPGPLWRTRDEGRGTRDATQQIVFQPAAIKPVDSHLAEVHCGTEAVKAATVTNGRG